MELDQRGYRLHHPGADDRACQHAAGPGDPHAGRQGQLRHRRSGHGAGFRSACRVRQPDEVFCGHVSNRSGFPFARQRAGRASVVRLDAGAAVLGYWHLYDRRRSRGRRGALGGDRRSRGDRLLAHALVVDDGRGTGADGARLSDRQGRTGQCGDWRRRGAGRAAGKARGQ